MGRDVHVPTNIVLVVPWSEQKSFCVHTLPLTLVLRGSTKDQGSLDPVIVTSSSAPGI